ncbi:hypothetical protein BHM03_00047600 [Ensete ventricosum]|uniref:Uncharacterized protein n=1 Tax=Ensete ventricosum TaxID=4639 RepID=A0A445ML59_ENSVE|nr:hypothetical protein BHM03_00047600 [Ensete ventricosum]
MSKENSRVYRAVFPKPDKSRTGKGYNCLFLTLFDGERGPRGGRRHSPDVRGAKTPYAMAHLLTYWVEKRGPFVVSSISV